MGLTLNRTKTRLCEARTEQFDFLGYSFGLHRIKLSLCYPSVTDTELANTISDATARAHTVESVANVIKAYVKRAGFLTSAAEHGLNLQDDGVFQHKSVDVIKGYGASGEALQGLDPTVCCWCGRPSTASTVTPSAAMPPNSA